MNYNNNIKEINEKKETFNNITEEESDLENEKIFDEIKQKAIEDYYNESFNNNKELNNNMNNNNSINNNNIYIKEINLNNNTEKNSKENSNKNLTFSEEKNNIIQFNDEDQMKKHSIFESGGDKNNFSPSKTVDYMKDLKKSNKIKSIILNSPPLELESINLGGSKQKIESYNRDDENEKSSFKSLSNIINDNKSSNKNLSENNNNSDNNNINNNENNNNNINNDNNNNDNNINNNYNNNNEIKKIVVNRNKKIYNRKYKKNLISKIPNNKIKREKHLCYKFTTNPQRFFTENLCDNILKAYDLIPQKKIKRKIHSASPTNRIIIKKNNLGKNKLLNDNKNNHIYNNNNYSPNIKVKRINFSDTFGKNNK